MKRVLILGGGFGGVATAHRLKHKLAEEDEIILIDRRPNFMVGFRKTWAMTGWRMGWSIWPDTNGWPPAT